LLYILQFKIIDEVNTLIEELVKELFKIIERRKKAKKNSITSTGETPSANENIINEIEINEYKYIKNEKLYQ